jgi:hypothetical protein
MASPAVSRGGQNASCELARSGAPHSGLRSGMRRAKQHGARRWQAAGPIGRRAAKERRAASGGPASVCSFRMPGCHLF